MTNDRRSSASLTRKLVLAFLLVTLIPLGVIIWVSRRAFVEQAEEQIGTRLKNGVVQVGRSIDEFLLNCISDMKSVAADPDLSMRDRKIIDERLSLFTYAFPYFDQVMLVDTQGGIVASSFTSNVGESLFTRFENTRDEFELAIHSPPGSVFISDLADVSESVRQAAVEGRLTDKLLKIQMLAPVQDRAGHCVGVLVGNVVTRQLLDLLQDLKQRFRGDEFPCLLDKEGRILMSTDPHALLLSTHPDVTSGALRAPLNSREDGYLVYMDSHGQKLMAGYTTLWTYGANKAGDWRLIALASYDTIMKPATKAFNRMVGILFATLDGGGRLRPLAGTPPCQTIANIDRGRKDHRRRALRCPGSSHLAR